MKTIDLNNPGQYLTGADAIRQNWQIILNTIKGSDPLRPNFGCGIFEYIDKPLNSSISDMSATIISDLEKWEPTVKINQVKIVVSGSSVSVSIYGKQTLTSQDITAIVPLSSLTTDSGLVRIYSDNYNKENYG